MSNDWIEHNGGPQPVADDVWVERLNAVTRRGWDALDDDQDPCAVYEARAEDVEWGRDFYYRILNQHLIDAARLEGIRMGLKAAEKYNRRAFDLIVDALRNTNPDIIAREAVLDQLTSEAQAQDMGYDND